ncbi:MAG TPA: hypothetical protein PK765_04340 [bacterium]|nr:hypothetical protein [bacterium]
MFFMNRFHAVGASVAVAVWALSFPAPVSASISDLDVSFCDSGISSKRLQLEIETLPWERVACVRYVNLGTETIDVALSATDGFVLADGKIGCADDSADTGAFSTLIRYE